MTTTILKPMEDVLAPEQIAEVAKGNGPSIASEPVPATSDSDEDMPLSQRALKVQKVSYLSYRVGPRLVFLVLAHTRAH